LLLASRSQQWLSFSLKMAVYFEAYLNFRKGDLFFQHCSEGKKTFSCLFVFLFKEMMVGKYS